MLFLLVLFPKIKNAEHKCFLNPQKSVPRNMRRGGGPAAPPPHHAWGFGTPMQPWGVSRAGKRLLTLDWLTPLPLRRVPSGLNDSPWLIKCKPCSEKQPRGFWLHLLVLLPLKPTGFTKSSSTETVIKTKLGQRQSQGTAHRAANKIKITRRCGQAIFPWPQNPKWSMQQIGGNMNRCETEMLHPPSRITQRRVLWLWKPFESGWKIKHMLARKVICDTLEEKKI